MDTNLLRDESGSDTDSDNENRALKCRVNANSLLQTVQIVGKAIIGEYNQERSNTSILTGRAYVEELLSQNTNEQRFANVFRMPQRVFLDLCEWWERGNHLRSTVNVDIKEQVAIISKNNTLRSVRPVRLTHLTPERKSRIRTQRRIDVAS